jgi:hypothetical protein
MASLEEYAKKETEIDYSRYISVPRENMLRDIESRLSVLRRPDNSTDPWKISPPQSPNIEKHFPISALREPYMSICIDNGLLPILYVINKDQPNHDMSKEGINLHPGEKKSLTGSSGEIVEFSYNNFLELVRTPIYRVITHCAGHKNEPVGTKNDFCYTAPGFSFQIDTTNHPHEIGNKKYEDSDLTTAQRLHRFLNKFHSSPFSQIKLSSRKRGGTDKDLRTFAHNLINVTVVPRVGILEQLKGDYGRYNPHHFKFSRQEDQRHPMTNYWKTIIESLNKVSDIQINPELAILITQLSEKPVFSDSELLRSWRNWKK